MDIHIFPSKEECGIFAADLAAQIIQQATHESDEVNIILATGASQFAMLSRLVEKDIQWAKVNVFHLDEYVGMPETHPASFRRYLRERFVEKVPALKQFIPVNGDAPDAAEECRRLAGLIGGKSIALACIGIGENGHIAFNDPPADFETERPYIVVELDEVCRRQQVGEGWFASLAEVPTRALSMSVKQLLRSDELICIVPQSRKAKAVQAAVEGPITPMVPASILRTHPNVTLYLDAESSSLLREARS